MYADASRSEISTSVTFCPIPGINIDSSIKCFHGFRGAYNNIYTYAHGVYTVKSVDTKGECKKVTLNHKDLKSKEN